MVPVWQFGTPESFIESDYVLGIGCTGHGASLALVGRDGTVRASSFDRWNGTKNTLIFCEDERQSILRPESPLDAHIHDLLTYAFGRFPEHRVFEEVFPRWLDWFLQDTRVRPANIGLVVTSDSHFATCSARLAGELDRWLPRLRATVIMEHHDVHQRQAFWQSGFESAAVLTLDTCGESLPRLDGRKLAGTIARKSPRGPFETLSEIYFPDSSPGLLYAVVNHHVGFRQGDEGKTMGLAPYGGPELFNRLNAELKLFNDGSFAFMDYRELQRRLEEYVPARVPGKDSPILEKHMNVAYAGQALLERIVSNAFACALRLTGLRDLAYAGGVALNSVANGIAMREVFPRRLYISPNPSDCGQSLGCALAGAYELSRWPPPLRELPDYLGPVCTESELKESCLRGGVECTQPPEADALVARCLANGHIVARYAGSAEFGPRALGNRSILCDPRRANMKDRLNARVKHREGFRPFAPTVLEEHAHEWFHLERRSSYMLLVVAVRDEVKDVIPAIVHVDGSARVQTVSEKENPDYWRLIDSFHRLTGVPVVLNTSFNVQGKPIVETPAQAVDCFLSTEIDVLAMHGYVLSKGPLSEYVGKEAAG